MNSLICLSIVALGLVFVWWKLYRTNMSVPDNVEQTSAIWEGWERWTAPTIYEIRDM